MNWPIVKIGDYCDLLTGGTPSTSIQDYYVGGDVPWVASGDIHRVNIYDTHKKITRSGMNNSPTKYLQKNSVLIALNGQGKTRGTVAMLRIDNATCNQSVISINPSDPDILDSYFLFQILRSMYQKIRNITGDKDRAGLNMRLINEIEFPLPPIKEQKRIAAILDQADALRQSRHHAITRLNDLSQSIFYEMFGDPSSNPHGFPVGTIRDLVREVKYGTSKKAHLEPDGLPILRMGNITYSGELDLKNLKYVHLADKEIEKYTAQKGDILFNRTNSKELVGKTAVFDKEEPFAIAGYLVRARTNKKANPYYIGAYLNSAHGKAVLLNMCKNIVGMANINAQEFQDIKIIIPPIDLQNEYQEKLELIEKNKSEHIKALNALQNLFLSLQQRAFRGEL